MERTTVEIYEQRAEDWAASKRRPIPPSLAAFTSRLEPGAIRLDLGCGPGWHAGLLGARTVAVDAAKAMLDLVPEHAPDAWRVVADLESLPFRRQSLGGTWAHKCYMHIPAERVPLALAELQRASGVGTPLHVHVTSERRGDDPDQRFAGRHFEYWSLSHLCDVITGAGFDIVSTHDDGDEWIGVEATRAHTLPDTVALGMRLLLVGLNPSVYAADAGVGFARPGNRFWPAALAAGLVSWTHDAFHTVRVDRVGMTDLVKRATRSASELSADEFRAGAVRVERLVAWLQPEAVCFVGLAGYRAAVDRKATVGWQPQPFAGSRAYVMPNPSGINAHARPADIAQHLRAALTPPRS
jgi:double-stranded uracil-DNA glycosylase